METPATLSSRYNCPRCHYKTHDRTDFFKHLNRVKPCPSLHSDQSQSDIISSLEKPYKCPHCDKAFSHSSSFYRHKKTHPKVENEEPEERSAYIEKKEARLNIYAVPSPKLLKQGVAYLATSSIIDGIKLGYWRGKSKSLFDRYKTYYGTDLEFYLFPCKDCLLLEGIAKLLFRPYNISLELHKQEFLNHYIAVLSYLCILPEDNLQSILGECNQDIQKILAKVPSSIPLSPVFIHIKPFNVSM